VGRYRSISILGEGGMGVVWRAEDTLLNRPVVVKRPRSSSPELDERARREALALRLLRIPGVVPLLDDGEDEEGRYLVTEYIDGRPFPGDVPASEFLRLTGRLLEILVNVHAAGIIHRDLKPANVLVDADGRPWLLDFGLAKGNPLGPAMTTTGVFVGTPMYLAPEQLSNDRLDARTDLYALGIVLYEVLTGEAPFAADPTARLFRDVPPVADRATGPSELLRLIDRLCARLPQDRPASAAEALAALAIARPAPKLRFVGSRRAVDRLVDAARRLVAVDVTGPPGIGRTRVLEESAEALAHEGRKVCWAVRGERPLSSLRATLGTAPQDPPARVRAAIADALDAGTVLVVDPPDALDPWSRDLLAELPGAILGVGKEVVTLEPLTERDLSDLFHGPDRVLHLPEDGARELYRRSAGVPARVVRVIEQWVDAGWATIEGEKVRLDPLHRGRLADLPVRAQPGQIDLTQLGAVGSVLEWIALADGELTLSQLSAVAEIPEWEAELMVAEAERRELVLRAGEKVVPRPGCEAVLGRISEGNSRSRHRLLGAVLPRGTRARLRHCIQADDPDEIATEAVTFAGTCAQIGRFGLAAEVLSTALEAARGRTTRELELELLEALVVATHAAEDGRLRAAVADAVVRSAPDRWGERWLLDLARASVAVARREYGEAEALLADVPALGHRLIEVTRATLLVEARTRARPAESADELQGWSEWAHLSPERLGRWLGWCGLAAYREARFTEAATLHAAARAHRTDPYGQLVVLVNESQARIEIPEFEAAAEAAQEAVARAAALRLPGLELRAWSVLRGLEYRSCQVEMVDSELVDAALRVDSAGAAAHHLLVEGIVAWRAGLPEARQLLENAQARFGRDNLGVLVCDVLLNSIVSREVEWASRLSAVTSMRLSCQLLALLADAGINISFPSGTLDLTYPAQVRLEILSPQELSGWSKSWATGTT
jgi:hypothetical protein